MAFSLSEQFLRQVAARFPADFLTREPSELHEYGRDWTRAHEPAPSAVVFPRSTEDVAGLLRLCHEYRVPVVPSGGRTGLAAGAVAAQGEVVLSMRRMDRIWPVDVASLTVRVQAGAVTQAVHQHVATADLCWPIDLASKGSSQVGGNIATNAGGVRVIRYGLTRQWVLGLQVVTAQGEVLDLNGALEKNNTGYDLRQLFIGSEGTLGVITEATLKLTRQPGELDVFLFAVTDLEAVLRLFRAARKGPLQIMAFEFMSRACIDRVRQHRGMRDVFGGGPAEAAGCYVLIEVERPERSEAVEEWLSATMEGGLVLDGVLAQDAGRRVELWALRESISETLSTTGMPHKNDIALPIRRLEPFCAEMDDFFAERYPGWEVFLFGHIGDGNLHVNVMKPDKLSKEAFLARAKEVDTELFTLVRRHGGSVSAEHGIGLLKKPYLSYSRGPVEVQIMRSIKQALDPRGILNPGKVFD